MWQGNLLGSRSQGGGARSSASAVFFEKASGSSMDSFQSRFNLVFQRKELRTGKKYKFTASSSLTPAQQRLPSDHCPPWEDRPIQKESISGVHTLKPLDIGTYQVKDNANHQTAAGTHRDLLAIAQIIDANLEAVAAWARERVNLHGRVEGHVFDFDLIVYVEAFVCHFVSFLGARG